jgi:WD40 repeat protein/tRNA A-37 threonylcarbamoyl transferase component Bud32
VGGALPPSAEQAEAAGAAGLATSSGVVIPGYDVLGELGRGGMGVVYKARQLKLRRLVALKMILSGVHAGGAERQRFLAEAEAVARLQHPNIVQIHEIGEADGHPFFSLEFCPGGSLAGKLNGTPLPPGQAAALVETLARAVQAAHEAGVVHRDLKPANVLLLADGTPKITDFGLAKKLDDAAAQTASGAIMGTPSYMAPEQAEGKSKGIGPAADVYALGAVLYEVLTGRPPFRAATSLDTVLQVISEEPVPPSRLLPRLPRDLETICLKCLHKEPAKRYASAAELADDLQRFQKGEPIRARPVGRAERAWRWCRRNPAVAGLLAAVMLTLLLGTAVASFFAVRANSNAQQAREEKQRADDEAREARAEKRRADDKADEARAKEGLARRHLYAAKMQLAQNAWREKSVTQLLGLLAETQPRAGEEDLRGFEWHYFNRLCHSDLFTLQGRTGLVQSVCFSPDGRRLATASSDRTVRVWDLQTGQEALALQGHTGAVHGVCFSPDGRRLASASEDQTVKVWDAQTGQDPLTLKGHTGAVQGVCFSPNSKRLASASGGYSDPQTHKRYGEVKVWDAQTGQEQLSLGGHTDIVNCVCFSPDGRRLATASWDQTVKVWDAQTGQEFLTLQGRHTGGVVSVCFSPDGRWLAGADGTAVALWSAQGGKELLTLQGHTDEVWGVCFSPDGRRLASASEDQTVKVWAVPPGQELCTFQGHTDHVRSVCFSPDGKRVASASREVKVWDAPTGRESLAFEGHTGGVQGVCFSPDGRRVATASWDKTVKVWDAETGQVALTLQGHTSLVTCVCFSPDGRRLASSSTDNDQRKPGEVRVWDAQTGQEQLTLQGHAGRVTRVCFSPDGRRLATASFDQTVKVWDAETGQEALTLQGHTSFVWGVCFSPDGRRLATASADRTVKVWDAQIGKELLSLKEQNDPMSVCFSPSGRRLACATSGRTVTVWDAQTGQEQLSLSGHTGPVSSVCFSPDGRRLASTSGPEVKVWDAQTGQEVLTFAGHNREMFYSVCFSPDGSRLAVGQAYGSRGKVKLWDARPRQE